MGLLGGLESGSESSNVEDAEQPQPSVPITRPPRHTSSKYDFVKVRVWLGDNSDHYYVLSRFLVSRMLTVTKIPNHVAIKIALELKKLLIDNSLLDVSQSDLEGNLFKLMERRGYGDEYISRYKMMTRFHHQRVPLVIIVCGTACVGKSTIATQLAQRLNLPNVLQTDMVYELLRSAADLSDNAPLAHVPIWQRDFTSPEELITEFCRECRIVRKGLDGDLKKAMKDGKPVIIEGIHLDPAIYLMDEKTEVPISEKETQPTPLPDLVSLSVGGEEGVTEASKAPSPVRSEAATETVLGSRSERAAAKNEASSSGSNKVASRAGSESSSQPGQPEESRSDQISQSESQSSGDRNAKGHLQVEKPPTRGLPKSIVVPIVLKMAEADHQALLDEWIASRSVGDSQPSQAEKEALTYKLQVIQDYLTAFEAQGMCVVDITVTTFPQTLDRLHSYLLECIERGCSTPSPRAGS